MKYLISVSGEDESESSGSVTGISVSFSCSVVSSCISEVEVFSSSIEVSVSSVEASSSITSSCSSISCSESDEFSTANAVINLLPDSSSCSSILEVSRIKISSRYTLASPCP